MCLLFSMWFASGIVMMYVDYPELTETERLDSLPELALEEVTLTPFEAASKINSIALFSSVKLTTVLNRPAFELVDVGGRKSIVFADSGTVLNNVSEYDALNAAVDWDISSSNSTPSYDSLIDIDQWSITASHNPHRPLHKVTMNDEFDRVLYVSSLTGQVILDTSRTERLWNWLGSTVHWIYPLALRRNVPLWTQVVVYTSLAGIVSVITGGIIGFVRLRIRKPYQGKDYSPYTDWMKWHHLLGMCSLVFVFTFMFSGLMSMDPWGVFDAATSPVQQINRYYGNDSLRLSNLPMPDSGGNGRQIKEVKWHQLKGESFYSYISSPTQSEVRFPSISEQNTSTKLQTIVNDAIPNLLPDANLDSIDLITAGDNYYYSRSNNFRPFPVYRAKFDDLESTWYHIDVDNGEIINRITSTNRLERWLFNGLHSLDFQFLTKHGPFRDVLLIFLSLAGFVFSLSAVIVGWRRLFS